jgi:hypothetical protein
MKMEAMTIKQAFEVMSFFLEGYYRRTHSEDVGALLGDLDVHLWGGDTTGDPAAWSDWMACVQKVLMPDTPIIQEQLHSLINERNHLGTDSFGNDWYAQLLPDGKQLWANVRSSELQYAGIRDVPRSFDPKVGLSSPSNP